LEQAAAILKQLEHSAIDQSDQQLNLFDSQTPEPEEAAPEHPVIQQLESLDPDSLTPREALEALYTLIRVNNENKQ